MNEQDKKEIEGFMIMPPQVSSELPQMVKPALPEPSDEDIRVAYDHASKTLIILGLILTIIILVILGLYWLP